MEVNNKYIAIKDNISGAPKESDFEIKNENLSLSVEQGSKDVIVKNLYVSIDSYQINRMKSQNSSQQAITYSIAITPGEAIDTYGVGRVVVSRKVQLLKEKLGFDDAFNYKEESDLNSCLKRYFSEGIDIYFDNVGGKMLEAAVANMNMFGRIAVCGVVSEYTNASKRTAFDMMDVVYKRITIQGFLAADHFKVYADFQSKRAEYLRAEKLKAIEDVSHGVESIPSAFIGLFRGDNVGKKIVQVADHISY
ncbi:nadp-dependent alkenal double bond reductase p1 [Nicotiana attenuata]|uniref:Nadp-dependent alkenal double bond reductase p1 n=1 Tax=Nicotiana attenuata TaxID=49451 RepID=A0A314LDX0_NICAT|nr:nadp-dependent alkenal double bond reductase p1 [Nicotiana attenuata]